MTSRPNSSSEVALSASRRAEQVPPEDNRAEPDESGTPPERQERGGRQDTETPDERDERKQQQQGRNDAARGEVEPEGERDPAQEHRGAQGDVDEVERDRAELNRCRRGWRHEHRFERSHQLFAAHRGRDAIQAELDENPERDPDGCELEIRDRRAAERRQETRIHEFPDEVEDDDLSGEVDEIRDEAHPVAPGDEEIPSDEGRKLPEFAAENVEATGFQFQRAHPESPASARNACSISERSSLQVSTSIFAPESAASASPRTTSSASPRT